MTSESPAANLRYTILESIATGNPPTSATQEYAAAFMSQMEGLSAPVKSRLAQIYERSGIERRFTCLPDYLRDPEDFTFFPKNRLLSPSPTTRDRNRIYRKEVVPLAVGVGRDALALAGISPDEVTHVVAVSCTGFFAPGLDIELVKRLGLRPTTKRTMVGFMGCYAAFNGLRLAHAFCQAEPGARVLLVCAELCTLHFQIEDTLESAVVNALFSDGAAAAVLASRAPYEAGGKLAYADAHCLLDDDSMGDMTWEIGDTGFMMGLSSRVPRVLARHVGNYVDELAGRNGLTRDAVDFWAIHPGGIAIVEKAMEVLGLGPEDVADSLEVLRQYGNMSSPTILFVLKRFLEQADGRGKTGIAMAFGPGLTIEGALFREVGSWSNGR